MKIIRPMSHWVHWKKGGTLRCLLSGLYECLGRLTFLGPYRSLSCRVTHRFKAWRVAGASQDPTHDLVPPSSLEGRPQMHQATDGGFPPKCPGGLEAQIDHPPHRTLDLARPDREFARLQGHIAHAMRMSLHIAHGTRDGLAPLPRGQ